MKYRRMPIEIEAPEGFGYDKIDCNLSESSFTDQKLSDLGIDIGDITLVYGDHKGKPELRELIAAENGVHADDVLITAGAATALFIVATTMLDKNDHLVVAKPNYATNIETPRAVGADISFIQLKFDEQFDLNLEKVKQELRSTTRLLSLTYPHNPTGVMINENMLREIINLVEKRNTYLLMDETYRDMSFVEKLSPAASLSELAISVSSMSKSYGLPGIRIGWIICRNKGLMETFLAAKEQICITNSVLDEEIAWHYFQKKDEHFAKNMATIRNNFNLLKAFMQGQQLLEWVEPKGGCVCFPRVRKGVNVDMGEFHKILLEKYGTYVGRGHWFEEDSRHMRIGYSWDKTENLQRGLTNIVSAIEDARI